MASLSFKNHCLQPMIPGFENKRILITGGRGYLATNLCNGLKDTSCDLRRLSRSTDSRLPMNGVVRVEDLSGDIRDRTLWERVLANVEVIYHFAAQTSVSVANENPSADSEINTWPILYLLETCRQNHWHPIVLFSGTVTETGIPSRLPVDETHPDNPLTIYDLNKLMAENYLKYYARQGTVRGATLRLSNVYGPGPASRRADRGVLNRMIRQALSGETLTIYGDGCQVRDYIYVEDVVAAFLLAGARIDALNGEHWIIGSGEGHTIAEAVNLVAERVALTTGRRVAVEHVDPPSPQSPIETRNFVADSSRFARATGWQARVSLMEGIDRTIEAFLKEESQP